MKIHVGFATVCLGVLACTAIAVEGQAEWGSPGRLGGAVSLNGESCLVGVDAGEFDAVTLSLWLRPGDQMQEETSIFSSFDWQEGALHWLLLEEGNLLLCMNGNDPEESKTKGSLKPNAWNHVALVYDQEAKYAKVYINGKQDLQVSYDDTVLLELYDFCVGAWNIDPRAFRGDIDDVRIYSVAMDDRAIAGLYQGTGPKTSLALWWRLDEKEGEKIRDHSGKKRHGFLRPAQFDDREEEGEEEAESGDWRHEEVRFLKTQTNTLLTHPLMTFDRILFVKRLTYHSSHFYTDFIDGCDRFGGNLCVLDRKTGRVTDLIPEMKHGIFGRFDLHFNAGKVVFDWKEGEAKGFRIFEIDIDPDTGTRTGPVRQLTFPPDDEAARIKKYDNHQNGGTARMYYHQTDDMHPCYLPDGGIVFTSSRCEFGTLCDGPDHLSTAVLHRIEGDGTNMQQLTNSPVSEFSPSIMDDGRVLYTRWEYVDKGQLGIKCLWAMQPDGSGSVEIYGNDIHLPPTFLHGRQIPGQSDMFVMLGTPHYPQSGIGTVIRVDTSKDIRTREPMTYMTPYVDIRQEPGWNHYENGRWSRHTRGPLYMDPFPLSDSLYMVAHNPDKDWDDPKAYGLYLIDQEGQHQQIHADPETSCWQPIPLRKRAVPPVFASNRDEALAKKNLAECYVSDIYQGMTGINRGEVKYIRVMEQIPRPWDCRQFWDGVGHTDLISRGTALAAKAMHGIVPVYKDGSAHFYVPADRNIYFQALDENFMELQRERTYVNYRPGERRSCVGCHETPNRAAPNQGVTIAMKRPAVMPGPQPGDLTGQQVMHFPSYVQPVLDRHCIECHGGDEPEGGLDLTGTMTDRFSRSYEHIMERGLVKTYREASDWEGSPYSPPKTIGSHASRFILALREGKQHKDLDLPLEDFARLATWVDASGVYYGSYWGRRRLAYRDHPNFRPVPTFAEALSTVCPLPVDQR